MEKYVSAKIDMHGQTLLKHVTQIILLWRE